MNNVEYKSSAQDKLEEARKKVINYKFLTPVSEYITKNYGEIESELTKDDLTDVIREIQDKHILVTKRPKEERIYTVKNGSHISQHNPYRYNDNPTKEEIEKEPLHVECRVIVPTAVAENNQWATSYHTAVITDLYYVNDIDKYANYILDAETKMYEKDLEQVKERYEKRSKVTKDLFADLKEANLNVLDMTKVKEHRELKAIADPKLGTKELLARVKEIAEDTAREVAEDHCDNW